MSMNRRRFFALSAVTGACATLPSKLSAITLPDPERQARLKLSCQEGVAPGRTLTEKLDFLEEHGFVGFEPGGGGLARRVDELKKAFQGRKIGISAVCAGFKGALISDQESSRQDCLRTMKEILSAAGELSSTGVILVPAFNGQTKLGHWEGREMLLKLLPELGDHAQKAGTRVLLEPLNREEAHFLRQVEDGAAICRDVNNPGIAIMGDFWHMTREEACDTAAFLSARKYLHHVHIASRKTRQMPGDDEGDNYVAGFKGLKLIGYQDFVSLECGSKGDRKLSVPAAAKLIREQWEQA